MEHFQKQHIETKVAWVNAGLAGCLWGLAWLTSDHAALLIARLIAPTLLLIVNSAVVAYCWIERSPVPPEPPDSLPDTPDVVMFPEGQPPPWKRFPSGNK